jgi:ELWxxDGT repeat protein
MLLNSPFGPLRPRKSSKRTVRRRPSRKRTLGFGSTSASFQELESRCMLAATLIQDIWTGASSSNPSAMASLNGNVLFAANDGPTPGTQHGNELWRSDGTAAVLVMDINPGTHFNGVSNVANDSNPTDLTTSSSFVYFSADDGVHGVQLWRSDGSAAGTTMVTDINEAGGGFNATDLTDVNGVLYFTADDGTHGSQVWKTDGTSGGTIMISNLQPTSGGAALPASITNVNGTVFFTANAGTTGRELYITTGTLGSTHLLVNIYQGTGTANPQSLLNVNGTLYFTANDGVHGTELWKSDGTVPGTVMVSDIFAGVSGSNPTGLTNIGNTVFFAANDGTNGTQLWKSTGTAASTVMVKDINTTSAGASSNPNGLTNVDGILFFGANDGIHGQELWKSDGTTAGTVLVLDINPGAASSTPANLINGNGTLFFTANDGTHGVEPWQSDGTAAGTVILQDINPGLPSSNPQNLATADGFLFMAANNGTVGNELWGSTLPTVRPIAQDHSYAFTAGAALNVGAPGVLSGTTGASGATFNAVLVSGPSNGVLVLNANGSFTYTPNAGFDGTDSFTFVANDGTSSSLRAATVTLNSKDYNFVSNLYVETLGRASGSTSSGEIMFWVNQLAGGASRTSVSSSFVNSTEARTNLINGFYEDYFGRPADPSGLTTFLNAMAAGATSPQVQLVLLSSNEYFLRAGGNAGFVFNLYSDLLNRTPGPSEAAYWKSLLDFGTPRTTVVSAFLTSTEYLLDVVQASYQTYLHRAADVGGANFWLAQLQAGLTPQQLEIALVSSDEFYNA